MAKFRDPNLFEAGVAIMGLIVILVGYFFIQNLVRVEGGLSWEGLQAVFLWMILISQIIIMAVNENIKEELKELVVQGVNETKLLKNAMLKKK